LLDASRILADSALLSGVSPAVIAQCSAVTSRRELAVGEYLFRAGDHREAVYFVVHGQLEIVDERYGTRLIVLSPGDEVGESAFLNDSAHGFSVRALTEVEVLSISAVRARALLRENADTAVEVLTRVAQAASRRLRYSSQGNVGRSAAYRDEDTRSEHDLLGDRDVPQDAMYGVQTLRAVENFPITGIRLSAFPPLVKAIAMVKQACARANVRVGDLDKTIGLAIDEACQEIIEGHWHGHFVVDMVQGGAGTSTNMNANEVIANRSLEILGHARGDYAHCHPNNHVNASQSTNDVYPTTIRVAILFTVVALRDAMQTLRAELVARATDFDRVVKMGRTQLQDAVPMTLGQEFQAFADTLAEDILRLDNVSQLFLEINLGGTAIGTSLNAHPEYPKLAVEELASITGLPLIIAPNLVEATSDTGAFVSFSSVLKRSAIKLSKMCNDLRLLSSGPRCGLGEINLPPVQPGSSIMPGKVNPVIPEVVNQVAFQVIGNDLTITMAAGAGQLQLNVMEPIIAFNVFQSLDMLTSAIHTLTQRCVAGITANPERCRDLVDNSIGVVTALVPTLGYDQTSAVAMEALSSGRSVREVVLEKELLSVEELDRLLSVDAMTRA
jgi:aspartate ammonia-lyase